MLFTEAKGSGPKRLSPVVPRVHCHTKSMIGPIKGINPIKIHQKDLSISCMRRNPMAMLGKNDPSTKGNEMIKKKSEIEFNMLNISWAIVMNSTKYQNSDRLARPLKVTYLLKQLFMASTKLMVRSFLLFSFTLPQLSITRINIR